MLRHKKFPTGFCCYFFAVVETDIPIFTATAAVVAAAAIDAAAAAVVVVVAFIAAKAYFSFPLVMLLLLPFCF